MGVCVIYFDEWLFWRADIRCRGQPRVNDGPAQNLGDLGFEDEQGRSTVAETPSMEAVKPSILCIRRKQMLTQLRKTLGNTRFLRLRQEFRRTLYNIHVARAIAE